MSEEPRLIFIIGAGRSGTTWLHLMMGSHPRIATGQESQMFNEYLAPLHARWQAEMSWPTTENLRKHGINSYLTEEEFIGLLRNFALGVLTKILREKPDATYLLEKSPNNSYHVELIQRCFPDARFIHVIRDGRDVAASMLKARDGWGRVWAPRRVEDAARSWVDAVRGAMRGRAVAEHYMEVRYENLLERGEEELARLFSFAGVDASSEEVHATYERFSFDKLKAGDYPRSVFLNPGAAPASGTESRREPPDFFRKGVRGDWKNVLTPSQERAFLWVAGDLLHELGYLDRPPQLRRPPISLVWRHGTDRARRWVARAGKRLLGSPN